MQGSAQDSSVVARPSASPAIPPHPVLADHYGSAAGRVRYVRSLFDETAPSYDRINAWMSLRTGERYRRDALVRAGLSVGHSVLDIACGTGVLARHAQDLVGSDGQVLALDPSLPMLEAAGGRGVRLRAAAIAECLPLPDGCVDYVSMGYALRHVADLGVAFREFRRVLRPGGRLLILEMVPPRSLVGYALTKLYLKYLVPALTSLVARNSRARRLMEYYWDTVDRCVSPQVVLQALADAGFKSVERTIQVGIMNEYTAVAPSPDSARPSGA
jgi:demethylmenaquinone methyltransferase / 2-methoxy-6-polyprenyl-1,4-benzoquinol methylase